MASYDQAPQQPQYAQAPIQQQPYQAGPPAAAPVPATGNDDVAHWTNRITAALNNPQSITGPVPESNQPWHTRFLEFFQPIDLCFVTCCCPCVTFGKTHHRLHHDPNLKDWSPVNASCLGWWASTYCCCAFVVPSLLQRRNIQDRFGLQGEFPVNCLKSWCCHCCDLIQQEKEAEYRLLQNGAINTQPVVSHEMKVPGQQQPQQQY